jgi:Enoyl-CoA hydratase/carnithine racemase
MQFKHVTLDFDGAVAILKLDHPEVMNAVSMDMLGGLGEALDAIDDRRNEVRCLVMTGAGRAFCAGANLQGRDNQKPGSRSNAGVTLETGYHPFLRRLRNLHCPIVTSVNGAAAGAGMSFALMGDMILCARSAISCRPSAASAGAGLRIDLAVAAADRQGALGGMSLMGERLRPRRRWNGVWSTASMTTRR